jgi:hypothetical protein
VAVTALARKLAVLFWHLLTGGICSRAALVSGASDRGTRCVEGVELSDGRAVLSLARSSLIT